MTDFHRLRPRLFILMVGAALVLTLLMLASIAVAGIAVRERNLETAREGLEEQGQIYLALLADRSALLSAEQLKAAGDAGTVAARAVQVAAQEQPATDNLLEGLRLVSLPNGTQTDVRPERITSVLIPADAPRAELQRDLAASSVLDTILPHQRRAVENIQYIAYVGPSGLVRVYPALDLTARSMDREVLLLEQFRGAEREQTILPAFRIPETLGALGLSSAIVTPIYADDQFHGLIIVYVSLAEVTNALTDLRPTAGGYGFLIDNQRTLVGAPLDAQQHLLNRAPRPLDDTYTVSRTVSPELDQVIEMMVRRENGVGEKGVARVDIAGQPYFVAYAPLPATGWSLGLVTPIDELTVQVQSVSDEIRRINSQAFLITLACALAFVALIALASLHFSARLAKPIGRLASAARAIAHGDYAQRVELDSRDEIGEVAHAFNLMSDSIARSHRDLESTVEARTEALQKTVARLEQALTERAELREQLQAVSTPVIPIVEDVVLLPLIGSMDQQRAEQAIQLLLQRIEHERARVAIVDITGIPVIDTTVAAMLVRGAQAVRLLGAEMIVTGIRPEVAETLIALGFGLDQLKAMGSLQAAMALAVQRAPQGNGHINSVKNGQRR